MGLFSHSKQKDKIIKYLKNENISYDVKNDKIVIELMFKDKGFSLSPYFIVDDEEDDFSMVINIKKIDKVNTDIYEKINSFNMSSKYFSMKISKEKIIYIEYNTNIDDNVVKVFELLVASLYELSDIISNI